MLALRGTLRGQHCAPARTYQDRGARLVVCELGPTADHALLWQGRALPWAFARLAHPQARGVVRTEAGGLACRAWHRGSRARSSFARGQVSSSGVERLRVVTAAAYVPVVQ